MASDVVIPYRHWRSMVEHARRDLPNECCGLLAGRAGAVEAIYPLRNAWASPIAYWADESDLFQAVRQMREAGQDMTAIYHSHPTSSAMPSRVDLRENYYGELPRVIVSLAQEPPQIRAFRLDEGSFWEIPCYIMQRTLVLLKPDTVQRRLVGRILTRLEDKGLRIVGLKMIWFSRPLAEQLYGVHQGKDFYEPLLDFMTRSPAMALVLEGPEAIQVVREMLGSTVATQAKPGTIRGDFGLSSRLNLVHASDSPESAEREIGVVFAASELFDYPLAIGGWIVPAPV